MGNVVKQITIIGEAIVSKDFVQVPELLSFRLVLSDTATNPLKFGILFINFLILRLLFFSHRVDTSTFRIV